MNASRLFGIGATALLTALGTNSVFAEGQGRTAPAKPQAASPFEVQMIQNVEYRKLYKGESAEQNKNKLDLYLPKRHKNYPVLFFVHGGAWVHGDKDFFGLYRRWGTDWAKRGVGVVVTNYRLSPGVQHPAHIQDVAKAFAWTHQNIRRYGGSAELLFVCGHSAGGHLAALLATDETHLKAEKLGLKAIRGAIPISGVYRVHNLMVYAGLGMTSANSDLVESVFEKHVNPLRWVFGDDAKIQKDASPLTHVKAGIPPFLILYGDRDLPTLPETAKEFAQALKAKKCDYRELEVKQAGHLMILLRSSRDGDSAEQAVADFIAQHTRKP
jgi:acetyl esterase/lipase